MLYHSLSFPYLSIPILSFFPLLLHSYLFSCNSTGSVRSPWWCKERYGAISLDKSLTPVSRSTPKQPPSWGHSQKQATGVNTPVLPCSEPAPSCTLHLTSRELLPYGEVFGTHTLQTSWLPFLDSLPKGQCVKCYWQTCCTAAPGKGYLLSLLPAQPRKHTASIRKALTSRFLEHNPKLQISYMHRLNMMFQVQPVTFSLLQPAKQRMGEIITDNKLFCCVIFYIICCLLSGRQKNCIPEYSPKKKVMSTLQRHQRKA